VISRRALAAIVVLLAPFSAWAHDAGITSVTRLFLDQLGERRYALSVVDTGVPSFENEPNILPARCHGLRDAAPAAGPGSRFVFECETPLTFDDEITLPWALGVVGVATWTGGSAASAYFAADGPEVTVRLEELGAGAGSRSRLARRYFTLGAEHILLGVDHLLFVFGLLLLVRSFGALVKTITAFTVAHSLTLGAAVLGLVSVARAPVEAAIALSIVLLAREIVASHRGATHLVHRWPWLVAFVFGLLHGLGFAGALGQIGLRSEDIPLALLFFNLGVEAGQLVFVFVVLAASRMLTLRKRRVVSDWLEPALGYSLGTIATLWFLLRLPDVWRGLT
jgi:hydrogenase/urease accessory protein HupE